MSESSPGAGPMVSGLLDEEIPEAEEPRTFRAALRALQGGSSASQFLLAAAVVVAVVIVGITHSGEVRKGAHALVGADLGWLSLAILASVALWGIGTVTQFGSMPVSPPVRQVFAVQIAASFTNHLLPAGSGGMAVNMRFLRRHGMSRGAAMGSVGLNSLAGLVTHLILLAAAIAVSPAMMSNVKAQLNWSGWWHSTRSPHPEVWVACGALAAAFVAVGIWGGKGGLAGRLATRVAYLWRRMVSELRALGAVVRHPMRASALWLGSLSVPLVHGLILYALLRSMESSIAVGPVMVVYVVVSSLAALVPSPGGVGALDVALPAAFGFVGVAFPDALGAVLGYRLLTVWVPLLPGAYVFGFLLRRRVI